MRIGPTSEARRGAPGRRAFRRPLHPCCSHARQPLSIHLDRPAVVRTAEHPALLRSDRPGHRRHGLDPGRAPRRPFAEAAAGGRPASAGAICRRGSGSSARTRSANCRILRRDGWAHRDSPGGRAPAIAGRLHELRSPLTRLDVAVDLALTSDDREASLGRIKRDIGRLSVLVNELLQLTRAEGDPSAGNLGARPPGRDAGRTWSRIATWRPRRRLPARPPRPRSPARSLGEQELYNGPSRISCETPSGTHPWTAITTP